uniref:Uncharacterized protein n=1 Tax=Arundo donax TaxID=35708 RepID=A0A0A8Y2V6_ARUDO
MPPPALPGISSGEACLFWSQIWEKHCQMGPKVMHDCARLENTETEF